MKDVNDNKTKDMLRPVKRRYKTYAQGYTNGYTIGLVENKGYSTGYEAATKKYEAAHQLHSLHANNTMLELLETQNRLRAIQMSWLPALKARIRYVFSGKLI